jgi:CRP/FNR family transcriptional regulator, anaerobic regulatory protein
LFFKYNEKAKTQNPKGKFSFGLFYFLNLMDTATAIATYAQSIKRLYPQIEDEANAYLCSKLSVHHFEPKQFYLKAQTVQRSIGFIATGLVRAFYIDDEGKEITTGLNRENSYATDYSAFLQQTPCKYYFQCLEKTTIVNLPYEFLQNCYTKYPSIDRCGRLIAEEIIKGHQNRIESFQFLNAEERYLNFVKKSPDLFNRVSLSYISTFLGIERPSLSRIRKKLNKK